MNVNSSPLSIGVSLSAEVTTRPGQMVTVPLKVYDSGSEPLAVTGKIVFLTSAAKATPVPAGWHAQVTPVTFTLQPGANATETLTFRVPGTVTGQVHVLNYEFAARALGPSTGSVKLDGAVAGTLTVHTPAAAPPPAATPTAAVVVGFLSLAALLTVGVLLIRRAVKLWRRIAHSRVSAPAPAPEQAKEVQR